MSKIGPKLLLCKKCKTLNTNPKPHHKFIHCYFIQCEGPNCFNSWYICVKHTLRFSIRNSTRFNNHFSTCNLEKPLVDLEYGLTEFLNPPLHTCPETSSISPNSNINNYDNDLEKNSNLLQNDQTELKKTDLDNDMIPYSHITNSSSKKFFDDDLNCKGDGLRCLVARAFTQEDNPKKKNHK